MAGFTSSNINYGDFYSGSMQPPVIANGLPTQSAVGPRPTGIADLYGSAGGSHPVEGALSLNGDSGLTSRVVHTVPLDMYGNPVPSATQAIEAAVPHASGTIDNSKLAYRATPDMRQTPPAPFRTAPAASSSGGMDPALSGPGMWADIVDMFGGGYLSGNPGAPTNVTADNGLFGIPAQGFATQPNPPPASIAETYAHPAPPQPKPKPALNVTKNIDRYLSESGYGGNGNGGKMTAGEQANAFRKSMGFGP